MTRDQGRRLVKWLYKAVLLGVIWWFGVYWMFRILGNLGR